MPRGKIIALRITLDDAQQMYEHAREKDPDEDVRPKFEMKAGDLKEELEAVWSITELDADLDQ